MSDDKEAVRKSAYRNTMAEYGDIDFLPQTVLKNKKRRKKLTSTTTKEPKVQGEQPVIVPPNQLNLFL